MPHREEDRERSPSWDVDVDDIHLPRDTLSDACGIENAVC
jgi:hypothetical protein